MIPRSYQVPQDKVPFLSPKKDWFLFPKIDHSNLTKTGKIMIKKVIWYLKILGKRKLGKASKFKN